MFKSATAKVLGWVFFVVFALFVVVQFNDADPEVWMPIYGFASLVSLLVALNRLYPALFVLGMVFYFAAAVHLFPPYVAEWIAAEEQAQSLQMTMPFQEEARESLGCLICFLVMTYYLFFSIRKKRFGIGV